MFGNQGIGVLSRVYRIRTPELQDPVFVEVVVNQAQWLHRVEEDDIFQNFMNEGGGGRGVEEREEGEGWRAPYSKQQKSEQSSLTIDASLSILLLSNTGQKHC
jgi:hypothetical protein